ncbi:MAG: mercuric transporter MerT family protein [Nitratireductor sp.]
MSSKQAHHDMAQLEATGARPGSFWAAVGALSGATAATACCIVPLALFMLGIGGAWIGRLTALAPYQPLFLGVAALSLGYGYWRMRRDRRCGLDEACARPVPRKFLNAAFATALALVAAALAFDVFAPALLGL